MVHDKPLVNIHRLQTAIIFLYMQHSADGTFWAWKSKWTRLTFLPQWWLPIHGTKNNGVCLALFWLYMYRHFKSRMSNFTLHKRAKVNIQMTSVRLKIGFPIRKRMIHLTLNLTVKVKIHMSSELLTHDLLFTANTFLVSTFLSLGSTSHLYLESPVTLKLTVKVQVHTMT